MTRNEETKVARIKEKLEEVFETLGVNLNDPSVKDTPKRIAKMWCNELFNDINYKGIEELDEKMTFFPNVERTKTPVTMTMTFNSWCEHHLLPFFGQIRVTYIPGDTIIGLSKIPRIVEYFSKRPQLQERLGKEIGDYLCKVTKSPQVTVEIFDTTHTCVSCRGIGYNADTNTTYVTKYEGSVM